MINAKLILPVWACATAMLIAGASAQAATFVYTATSGNDPFTASGTLNLAVLPGQPGVFAVTGIDAVVDAGLPTQDVSKALYNTTAPGQTSYTADGLFYFNNLVYAKGPAVDLGGIEFVGATGVLYNLFAQGGSYTLYEDANHSFGPNSVGALSVSGIPEPATWATMLVGFFGLGAAMRVRRRVAAAERSRTP